jgi:hypothetical protein
LNLQPLGIAGLQPFDAIDEGVDDTWPGLLGLFHKHVLSPLQRRLLTTYNWLKKSIRSLASSLGKFRKSSTNMARDISLLIQNILWYAKLGFTATFNWFKATVAVVCESLVSILDRFKNQLISLWRIIRRSGFVAAGLLVLFIGGGIGGVVYALHHPNV